MFYSGFVLGPNEKHLFYIRCIHCERKRQSRKPKEKTVFSDSVANIAKEKVEEVSKATCVKVVIRRSRSCSVEFRCQRVVSEERTAAQRVVSEGRTAGQSITLDCI